MAARQTSIITTTAPPAPNLALARECARMWPDLSRPCSLQMSCFWWGPTRVEQHPSGVGARIALLLALVTRVSAATIAPRNFGVRGDNRKLAHTAVPSLNETFGGGEKKKSFVPRSLGFSFVEGPAANHIELPFTQSLLVPQITRLHLKCLTRPQPTR